MEILVKQVSSGDRKAYAALFHEFYTPLLLYSIKFTRNRDASEDIVQDFFCRLWEDRKRLINDKSFHAYIYSSVRNRSLNYLRDTHSVSIEGFEKQSDEDFLREMMEE
ncbi:MAG: sigma factor, partial [Butyricimonas faecihominis]